jgi:pyruvate formate lyase activating enzyme
MLIRNMLIKQTKHSKIRIKFIRSKLIIVKLAEKQNDDDHVRCLLCPHSCLISRGERGLCGVRENIGGEIRLNTYGVISGFALDPIEKKPLYHFYPGKNIISAGSYGCNLKCDFCQNYHISQNTDASAGHRLFPVELVSRALKAEDNIGIAYTYNEPVIWYEYVTDCARLAAGEGLKNVMVTNGYVNRQPLLQLIELIDAFNIDLKSFDNQFYRKFTGATLKPVLDSIIEVAASGRHLEITTLIIPGLNDSADEMRREAEWIAINAGAGVPLHISRYYPMYKRDDPPTPSETIWKLKEAASEYLDFVYTGNMAEPSAGSDTICPQCKTTVIRRSGYRTTVTALSDDGRCLKCSELIVKYR